jgi:hypothetical protein
MYVYVYHIRGTHCLFSNDSGVLMHEKAHNKSLGFGVTTT